ENIKKELEEKYSAGIEDITKQLEEKNEKIKEFQNIEKRLRDEKRRLEEEKEEFDLKVAREVDEKIKEEKEKTEKLLAEKYQIELGEKDKTIKDLQKALDEALRKASSGSAIVRGEIQELNLEYLLKQAFPIDDIKPVARGKPGGDVVHVVKGSRGFPCGVILWESKRTKNWNDSWLDKIREDLREIKGNIPIIVSEVIPKEIDSFDRRDNVWITKFECVIPLATVLRDMLQRVAYERTAATGRGKKEEILYNYITSHEFRQRVEAIVEVFKGMQS
ncbi:unnamed protein product, partial [marine sediment metagenome]